MDLVEPGSLPRPAAWRFGVTAAAIAFTALLLRTVALGDWLEHPFPDEASNAVDARCLADTGADRHGAAWPLYLRAFDDHREGPFTDAVGVLLFLNAATVTPTTTTALLLLRWEAALAGVLTVMLTTTAGRRWFGSQAGLWAGLFLAVNPQHVLWSRLGMEVVLGPTVVAVVLLAAADWSLGRRRPAAPADPADGAPAPWWSAPAIALGLAALVYAAMMGKALAAVLMLALTAQAAVSVGRRRFQWGWNLVAVAVLALALTPALRHLAQEAGWARWNAIRATGDSVGDTLVTVVRQYATYWSPGYLLGLNSGQPLLPIGGRFGSVETVAFYAGVALLLRRRPPGWVFWTALLLLLPLPAALSATIAPSRVAGGLPAAAVVMGLAAAAAVDRLRSRSDRPTGSPWRWAATALLVAAPSWTAAWTAHDAFGGAKPALSAPANGVIWRSVRKTLAEIGPGRPWEIGVIDPAAQTAVVAWLFETDPPPPVYQGKFPTTIELRARRRTSADHPGEPTTVVFAFGRVYVADAKTPPDFLRARRRMTIVPR
ncbi:MAG: hypothetical protein ACRC1K_13350 [Planctomycetia bacterium]